MDETNIQNVVQETSNYDKFSFLMSNREQSRGHVENLKYSLETLGNFTKAQPVLVNERFQIIDGQHRFTACQELGLPIFYTVVHGLGVEEARTLNIMHRGWTIDDYAHSYASAGHKDYVKYSQLKEEYGLSHSLVLYAVAGERSHVYKQFREGTFTIGDEDKVRERLDKLVEVREVAPSMNRNRSFNIAVMKAFNVEGYDHKRMVRKLKQYGASLLKQYSSIPDNTRLLEDIYNYNQAENTRLRFF